MKSFSPHLPLIFNPKQLLEAESRVEDLANHYFGTSLEALYTSQEDYQLIFQHLKETRTWCEFGSGYGLGPMLFASQSDEHQAVGIEFDQARFEFGENLKNQLQLSRVEFIHQDLNEAEIPKADVYFFYFPTGPVLDKLFYSLGSLEHDFLVVVIESHGDFLARIKLESWLKLEHEIKLQAQRHYPNACVFRKVMSRTKLFHDYSFQQRFFIIKESSEAMWIGDSQGMSWDGQDQFSLIYPNRTFKQAQVVKVLNWEDLSLDQQKLVLLRRAGEVKILTRQGIREGFIRKLWIYPRLALEMSSGGQVEWDDIQKIYYEDQLCFDSCC